MRKPITDACSSSFLATRFGVNRIERHARRPTEEASCNPTGLSLSASISANVAFATHVVERRAQRRLRPAEERFHSQVNLQGQEGATRARKRGVAQAQRGGRWWARPASGEIFLVLRPPPSVSRSVTERLIVERCSTFSADRIRSVAGWTMTSP